MHRKIEEVEFTIFDTETTGLNPLCGDRIVEIAAIRLKAGKRLADFSTLVNPGRQVSAAAFAVNRITQELLAGAPKIEEVLPGFLDFIAGSCLCSFNAAFDMGFLKNELELSRMALPPDLLVADILTMARRLLPGLERYPLWFLAQHFGIKESQKHRALADVELTLEVFCRLCALLKQKEITGFADFISLFGLKLDSLQDLNNRKLSLIQEAIDSGLRLKLRYLSCSSAQVSEREVIPKELKQQDRHSYLVGFCCLKNEERTFRLDSILEIETV
jgi:DNA polymerase III epsilon subunit family exonuclease